MRHCNVAGRFFHIIFMVIGGIALAILTAAIFGIVVMYLWNWLMPVLFGLKTIGYWQALGLVLLAKLVFGHLGYRHGGHPHCGHGHRFWKKMKHMHRDYPEIAENYEEYCEFWEKEGSRSFSDFLRKNKNDNEKE